VNERVLRIYAQVMSYPVGPSSAEYKRTMRKYVKEMSSDETYNILSRAGEIEEKAADEFYLREQIFLELGFMQAEAHFFARCRLNSPGIRTLIEERVKVTKHATADEIRRINEGDGGTLLGLNKLYGRANGKKIK